MHLDEDQVQRLVDPELTGPAEALARAHLAACADCRARVAQAEQETRDLQAMLRALDHAPPVVHAHDLVERAAGRRVAWRRWAAGVLLVLGAGGVTYAMPGSPLRTLVRTVGSWGRQEGVRPAAGPGAAQAVEPGAAGIAVSPGQDFLILFTAPLAGARARVSLSDGDQVVVRAPTSAASYTSDPTRLTIVQRDSTAVFEIVIPRHAPRVEIRVRDRRIFLKEGGRMTAETAGDTVGPFVLPLGPFRP